MGNFGKIALTCGLMLSITTGCSQKDPAQLVEQANVYVQQGDREAAIIELKNVVSIAPDFIPGRVLLGNIYFDVGRLAAAEKELRRAVELGAVKDEVIPTLVKTYYHLDQFEAARDIGESHSLTDPDAESTRALFTYLASLREVTGQAQDLPQVSANMSDSDQKVAMAYKQFLDRNYANVDEILEGWSSDAPHQVEMQFLRGLLYFKLKDYFKAQESLAAAKEQMPHINSVNFILIESMLNAKQFEKAKVEVAKLFKINENHPLVNKYKAIIEQNDENHTVALQFAEKAIQNGLDNLELRVIAGLSAYRAKVYERAYRHLNAAAQIEGSHQDQVKRVLTSVQLNLGYNVEAAESLQSISALNKDDAKLFAMTGTEFALSGDDDAAAQLMEQAAQIDEQSSDVKLRQALLQAGKDDELAVDLLKEAVELDDSLNVGWMQMALAHLRNGDREAALQVAEEWKSIDETSGKVLAGYIHLRIGEFEKTREVLNEVVAEQPEHIGAQFYILHSYSAEDNQPQRYAKAKDILNFAPQSTRALVSLIESATKMEATAEAETFLRELSASKGVDAPMQAVALMKRATGSAPEAVEILESLETLDSMGYFVLADTLVQLGENEKAIDTYEKMSEVFPRSILPLTRIAGILERQGELQDALKYTEKALELVPLKRELKLLKLHYLTRLNRGDEANRLLADLAAGEPGQGEELVPLYAGQIALNEREYEKAQDLLADYHQQYQTYPSSLMLAKALIGTKNVAEAEKVIDAQLAMHAETPDKYKTFAADFYGYIGKYKKAADLYQDLASRYSDNISILNNYAYNQLLSGEQLDKAREAAQKAVSLSPDNAALMDTLGWIEYKTGNMDEAYRLLSNASALASDNNQINLHLAELLIEMGLVKRAKEALSKVTRPNVAESKELEALSKRI